MARKPSPNVAGPAIHESLSTHTHATAIPFLPRLTELRARRRRRRLRPNVASSRIDPHEGTELKLKRIYSRTGNRSLPTTPPCSTHPQSASTSRGHPSPTHPTAG